MSNFMCSECGMTNIDCGSAGYKTLKEIELEKKLEIATKALKEYTINKWNFEDEYYNYPLCSGGWCHAEQALKEIDSVGTSAKEEV